MEGCNQTNIPILNTQEDPCIQGSLLTNCIFYGLAIEYLGTQNTASLAVILEYIVRSLVAANSDIVALEEENRDQQLLIEQLQVALEQSLVTLEVIQSQVEACCPTTTTTTIPITTSTTTTDPFYYYVANQYACPDCNYVVGTNMIIKTVTPLSIGDWVPRAISGNIFFFNVLSSSAPFYMATLVDAGGASQSCGCPGTTTSAPTTTTTTTSGPNAFSVTWVSPEQTFSCELPRITVYSSSNVISNNTRLFRNSNLTNELQDGTLYVQVLPFGEINNMRLGTYIEGSGLYALNGITSCDDPNTTTTTTI
jgi:hypothetical protein